MEMGNKGNANSDAKRTILWFSSARDDLPVTSCRTIGHCRRGRKVSASNWGCVRLGGSHVCTLGKAVCESSCGATMWCGTSMSWEGWRGHLHSTRLRRAAHERKIGTHEGSDKGTAPALRGAEHVARSERAERQARVVKTREQQRSRHDGGGLVGLQATAESASSRNVHTTVRLCRPSPEVRESGLAA